MGKRNTLVVEDDDSVRTYLMALLEEFDHECVGVASTAEASAAFDASPFDLVVLDLTIPGNEGCRLVHELRATREVPVLLISGAYANESAEDLIRDGKAYFLLKPFRAAQLKGVLEEIRF